MKKSEMVLCIVFFALLFCLGGCECGQERTPPCPSLGRDLMVLQDIYDDQQNTAYIKVDDSFAGDDRTAIADIMSKKKKWEQQFPTKKLIAMSVVTGKPTFSLQTLAVLGLLIHYERR